MKLILVESKIKIMKDNFENRVKIFYVRKLIYFGKVIKYVELYI